jgi:hypothetical protein
MSLTFRRTLRAGVTARLHLKQNTLLIQYDGRNAGFIFRTW